MIWHSAEASDVLKELAVEKTKGLANGVADIRIEQYGKNIVGDKKSPSLIKRIFMQLNNKFVYILAVVAVLSFVVSLIYGEKDYFSPLLIIAIVVLNSVITAVYMHRCDIAIDSLKGATDPMSTVLRDGIKKTVPSSLLVPGDILLLKAGDYITADARLVETNNFRCNEVSLTGINIPVDKTANITVEDITPVDKRVNMVYSGCSVVSGKATAVVVETGTNSETGHTAALIDQQGSEELPVKSVLNRTENAINIFIIAVCIIVFIISLIQNSGNSQPFASMSAKALMNSVALAIAAIPEGLPAIATVVVALGIRRIIKDGMIVKKAKALELLGKTTVICSDKTGIITKNHMQLDRLFDGEKYTDVSNENLSESDSMLLKLAASCSTLENDSTETSIEEACNKYASITKEELGNLFPRLAVIPFDSERKTMTSINMISGKPVAIVKGAPEMLADKFSDISADKILKANEEMASDALRVICIGIKQLDETPSIPNADDIECDLVFAGLIGLSDPPKSETLKGISICDTAGIKTIMITGDNIITAKAVARRIGILKDNTDAVTGTDIASLSDEELASSVENYSVYARITPADKLRIIKAWQDRGAIVAVTGDSLNDADALAKADIGCAMGAEGTDVAKGNADLIIKNSNFISVVNAIKESRGLFANIQKSVSYILSSNLAEILVYVIGMIVLGTPPLLAVQLLWINLLTDCTPLISLSGQKAEKNVMNEKPLTLTGRLLGFKDIIDIPVYAIFMTATAFIACVIGNHMDFKSGMTSTGMTMTFFTLCASQIFHSFNLRTHTSIFKSKMPLNDFMGLSSTLILFILFFLVLTPAGFLFGLTVLTAKQVITSLLLSLAVIPFGEAVKLIKRHSK